MRRSVPLFLFLLAAPVPLFAGDPVPDVDVTVEQVPGASIAVEAPSGGAFDEVRVQLPRGIAKDVSPGALPAGWTLTRDGRDLVLKGPEVTPPVRLRMTLGGNERPKEVGYEVRRGGAGLVKREGVVPRAVPPHQVRNSLQGIVYLPSEVAPGETITFRAQPDAPLPPGGRFVLSGVVAEPIPETEWPKIPFAIVNTTRSNIRKAMVAALPPEGLVLLGGSCEDLAPLASALVASGNARQSGPVSVSREAGATASAHWSVGAVLKTRHDTAKNAIGNMKFFEAAAPISGDGAAGISIKEQGIEEISIKEQGVEISIKEKGIWRVAGSGGGSPLGIGVVRPPEAPSLADPKTVPVALRGEPTQGGCRFTAREPSWLETWRASQPPQPAAAPNTLSGTVYAVEVPEQLAPGTLLSLQFIDLYGDAWVDVPAVPGTEVVPPRSEEGEGPRPCIRTATRFFQDGDLVCVCGTFPTPEASNALRFGDLPAGPPVSASSTSAWLRQPRGLPLGRHVISGAREAGFDPAACQAPGSRVGIRGEIDSQRLLRGESTPMRLFVDGTSDPVPLKIRNLTPAIIDIEGGLEQTTESTGGASNTVTRQVRGLTRGNFNVEWSVAVPPCPCGSEGRR